MRSLRLLFTVFIMSGVSLFVCAGNAYADTINIAESLEQIRLFEVPNKNGTNITVTDIENNYNTHYSWLKPVTETTGNESGTANSSSIYWIDSYYTTYVNYGANGYQNQDYVPQGTNSNEIRMNTNSNISMTTRSYLKTDEIEGFNSSIAAPAMGLVFNYTNNILQANDRFKPLTMTQMLQYVTTNAKVVSLSNIRVWVGTSMSNLEECTASAGWYTTPRAGSIICITFTGQNRTIANLAANHYYVMNWKPTIYLDIPNTTMVQLISQTVTNKNDTVSTIQQQTQQQTTSINNKLDNQTTSITNKVEQETQQQTSELKDTTGSGDILSDAVDTYQDTFTSKLGFIAQTADLVTQLWNAVKFDTSVNYNNATIHFPGVYWDGNAIWPEQDVRIAGWLDSSIYTAVKNFNTTFLTLLWIHGMVSLYHRIVHGSIEVEDDSE